MTIRCISHEDICLWPDGSWCFHGDLEEYGWMSDDYEVLLVGTDRWNLLTESTNSEVRS